MPAPSPIRVLAVDWSGAKSGARKKIWLAEVVDGGMTRLESGRIGWSEGWIVSDTPYPAGPGRRNTSLSRLEFPTPLPASSLSGHRPQPTLNLRLKGWLDFLLRAALTIELLLHFSDPAGVGRARRAGPEVFDRWAATEQGILIGPSEPRKADYTERAVHGAAHT